MAIVGAFGVDSPTSNRECRPCPRPGACEWFSSFSSRCSAAPRARPCARRPGSRRPQRHGAAVARGREVRPFRSLGRLLPRGQGRMGHGAGRGSDQRVRKAPAPVQPDRIRRRRAGSRPSRKPGAIIPDHGQAARRLLPVRHHADPLRHRRCHPVRQGPARRHWPTPLTSTGSSSTSITRCSTGTTPTTTRPARPAGTPAARRGGLVAVTSPTTRARSASSAPSTARSVASSFDGSWDRPDADWDLESDLHDRPRPSARRPGGQQPTGAAAAGRRLPDLDRIGRAEYKRDLAVPSTTLPRRTCLS